MPRDSDSTISSLLLILLTILVPPAGVYLVAGCGVDVIINILLTILGYFPGHIHAFYVEYVYYKRREERSSLTSVGGANMPPPMPGVYSDNVQSGGRAQGYGTIH